MNKKVMVGHKHDCYYVPALLFFNFTVPAPRISNYLDYYRQKAKHDLRNKRRKIQQEFEEERSWRRTNLVTFRENPPLRDTETQGQAGLVLHGVNVHRCTSRPIVPGAQVLRRQDKGGSGDQVVSALEVRGCYVGCTRFYSPAYTQQITEKTTYPTYHSHTSHAIVLTKHR
ncbi:hypothetical protein MAR_002259 [Mya arenaria]|uniref:Uncharacterized protein n=1 Tax=Mya arenaria TaxID=6604 RepID=A0ABY7FI41_MYAAR|nr:hypothetical protein MAR_002259 [Mya arenaria]